MRTVLMLVTATCLLLLSLACGGLGIGGCPEQEAAKETWLALVEDSPDDLPKGRFDTGVHTPGVIALFTANAIDRGAWDEARQHSSGPKPVNWPEPWRSRWTEAREKLWAARVACDPSFSVDTSSP